MSQCICSRGCRQSPSLVFDLFGASVLGFFGLVLGTFFLVGLLLFSLDTLLLPSDGLRVSGNEEIDQLGPFFSGLEGSSQDHDLAGEDPEDGSDGLGHSVVAGNDDIDEFERGVSVAKSNGGDVDIGSLDDCLVVTLGVSNNEESGLLELLGDLIGQGSGNPPGGGGGSAAGILAELVDGPLSVFLGADDDDLGQVGDGGDDSGCKFDSFVDFINFEDVVACSVASINEGLHVMVDLLGSQVHVGSQEAEDIRGLSVCTHCHKKYQYLIFNQSTPSYTPLRPTNKQSNPLFYSSLSHFLLEQSMQNLCF